MLCFYSENARGETSNDNCEAALEVPCVLYSELAITFQALSPAADCKDPKLVLVFCDV